MKMVILPKLISLFLILNINTPIGILKKIQIAINKFIWDYKKPRLRQSILEKVVRKGGLAAPNSIMQQFYALNWWGAPSNNRNVNCLYKHGKNDIES